MAFRPRNPYYLRVSERSVLPLYLYLDEKHLDWMNDAVLQHVLEDLRPNIIPKLRAELELLLGGGAASAKKASVDTHRGDTYQFCYFLRKSTPHSVVLKTRNYVAAPPREPPTKASKGKRKKSDSPVTSRKKLKNKGRGRAGPHDGDAPFTVTAPSDRPSRPKRSTRANTSRRVRADEDEDDPIEVSSDFDMESPQQSSEEEEEEEENVIDLEIEEEEEKPKPILQLKYRGFRILAFCLCIVVEPWPRLPTAAREASVFRASQAPAPGTRALSVVPLPPEQRAKTPLFLPDDFDRDRSVTPAPEPRRVLPPVPLFQDAIAMESDDEEDEDGLGGMMQFSQVLNTGGDFRAGAVDDDDDMEGAIMFGDADERREL